MGGSSRHNRQMSGSTKVRMSSSQHPAADLDKFVDSRLLSTQAHMILPVGQSRQAAAELATVSGALATLSQSWGFSSMLASLGDLVAAARSMKGVYAVSATPREARGAVDSESAAVLGDGSVHLRVSKRTYERIGVMGRCFRSSLQMRI